MIDRLTDAIIADWPVYLLGAVVYALCLFLIWIGWRILRDAIENAQNKEIEAEADGEKDGSVKCPQCKGSDPYCMFCEGLGTVTACQSREWLVQNPASERSL